MDVIGRAWGTGLLDILVVEDEPLILMDIEGLLQLAGHRVIPVANADAAIAALANTKIDMILTDVDMPGSIDGLGLAVFVKARWPLVGIVIMSGKNHPPHKLPVGARFLSKPLDSSNLLAVLEGALQQQDHAVEF